MLWWLLDKQTFERSQVIIHHFLSQLFNIQQWTLNTTEDIRHPPRSVGSCYRTSLSLMLSVWPVSSCGWGSLGRMLSILTSIPWCLPIVLSLLGRYISHLPTAAGLSDMTWQNFKTGKIQCWAVSCPVSTRGDTGHVTHVSPGHCHSVTIRHLSSIIWQWSQVSIVPIYLGFGCLLRFFSQNRILYSSIKRNNLTFKMLFNWALNSCKNITWLNQVNKWAV